MISNDRSTASGQYSRSYSGNKPGATEESIKTEKIQIERKTFIFALKDNPRGRFLRITEDVSGRRDTIIIPATGLNEFRDILDQIIQAAEDDGNAPEENPASESEED